MWRLFSLVMGYFWRGSSKEIWEMENRKLNGLMGLSCWLTIRKTNRLAKLNFNVKIKEYIKVILMAILRLGKEKWCWQMALPIKEIGKMINPMEKEYISFLMAQLMKASSHMVLNQAKENMSFLMDQLIKEIF